MNRDDRQPQNYQQALAWEQFLYEQNIALMDATCQSEFINTRELARSITSRYVHLANNVKLFFEKAQVMMRAVTLLQTELSEVYVFDQ